MSDALRVGIAGLGTVGAGVVKLLADNADRVAVRAGRPIEVVAVSARDRKKKRGISLKGIKWHDDALDLADNPKVDVVVELIGGAEGLARKLFDKAVTNGRAVVTANKALLAHHGVALLGRAEDLGVPVGFEAAVAGGIPILKALREGLAGNNLSRVYGILNGTCNYILTEMRRTGRDFADVLAEAQALGYAEADPSFDVDGIDAAHKLSILASLAFNTPIDFKSVRIEGIRKVSAVDIAYAEELGLRIKLLAVATRTEHGLEQTVQPSLVPVGTPIAHVDGVFNAVVAEGDFVGRAMFEGRGAGAGPTASAVVADLIDLAAGRYGPALGVPVSELRRLPVAPIKRHVGRTYMRLSVLDQPGVLASVSAILRDLDVSIESLLQRGRATKANEPVAVVIITHEAEEAAVAKAADRIAKLKFSTEPPHLMRIEQL